ncbi:cellulase-like Ig domain-containing protein [Lentzea atacamensis]|uniref:Cellulase-like Ig domain-containing protein n=1 Tax=Lentzea atacamensis TaxID=531938 RepID=A0ABX9E1Y8_9PSEU|nr:glycoside hydrolase family 9 protein [Lentzea atacamensis]RAS60854.1 cellulase-like Ig domain-containing protein [Lentzea atacamensis]
MRIRRAALVAAVLTGVVVAPAQAAPAGHIRLDQVGFGSTEAKHAYVLGGAENTRFTVVDSRGRTVLTGRTGASTGSWSDKFPAVHPIDFSSVKMPGTYRIKVGGATSTPFKIDTLNRLFQPVANNTVEFFQAQRDGANVIPGRLNRKPAHLTDRDAMVYEEPVFKGEGGDQIAAPLKPTGVKVDVEGGWFDAGDFVKFTHASSYSTASMLLALRNKHNDALYEEAKFGLKWLDKVWDEKTGVLYAQVGIGTGSEEFGFVGDHDVWRLPEADDQLDVKPGDSHYYIKHRPVFRANKAGEKISPNLVGRVAGSFALAAQIEARRNPRLACQYLEKAASLFALAKTENVGELVTAFPHAYYPESSWTDDLEFGATQLALAAKALNDKRYGQFARAAAHWAKEFLATQDPDTLNVYNISALGHADLAKLLKAGVPGAEVTEAQVVGDIQRQLQKGADAAKASPFRTAANVETWDVGSRTFGFITTAALYKKLTGDRKYETFGTQQRGFALGTNAWGTTLIVGVGSKFPECPHHQAANLSGSPNGGSKVLVGAVINGPNDASLFGDLGEMPPGSVDCTKPYTLEFNSAKSVFADDLRSWPSSEPAIDFTATGVLGFSLIANG